MKWYKRYSSNRETRYRQDRSDTEYPRYIDMTIVYNGYIAIRAEYDYRYLHVNSNGEIYYTDSCYQTIYSNGDRHHGAGIR